MRTYLVCICAAMVGLSPSFGQPPSKDLVKPWDRILEIRTLAFSPDGSMLAGGAGELKEKGEVVIWDAKTLRIRHVHPVGNGVPSVAFSPDGKTLAVGTFSENCYLLDTDTGKIKAVLPGHGESARSVAFAPDGKTLAVGSYDTSVYLWDWRAGKLLNTLKGHDDKVYGVAYSPDGKILVSSGNEGSTRSWEAATGKPLQNWEGRGWPAALDPKGQWLAASGNDASVSIRDLHDPKKVWIRFENIFAYRLLVIHPLGKSFAASSGDKTVGIFSLDLRQATAAEQKQIRELMSLWDDDRIDVREKASQDLAKLGTLCEPFLSKALKESPAAEVRVRARETLRLIRSPKATRLEGHQENVTCGAFSPDGQVFATGGRDGLVLLWDTATYKLKEKLTWPGKGP